MRFFRRKIEGKTADEWFELGFRETDPGTQVRYYSKCLDIDPYRADALVNLGEAFRELKKHEDAIRCFDKALEIRPKDKFISSAVGDSKDMSF